VTERIETRKCISVKDSARWDELGQTASQTAIRGAVNKFLSGAAGPSAQKQLAFGPGRGSVSRYGERVVPAFPCVTLFEDGENG